MGVMSEPQRLTASGGLGGRLLASARGDQAPAASRRRALAVAAAAVVATKSIPPAAAAVGAVVRGAVWKWVSVGVAGVVAVVAARAILAPVAPRVEVAEPLPVAVAAAPSAAPVAGPTATPPSAVVAVEAPADSTAGVAVKAVAARRVAVAPPAIEARGTARLSDEIAAIDEAKRALSTGDPAAALGVLDRYDRAFPHGTLAPESAALRIQVLARAGRKPEARSLLAAFRANHPDSPLLDSLGHAAGD
jgi:hypothetical protein